MKYKKWPNVEYFSEFTKEELKTNLKKILKKRISKNCRVTINLTNRNRKIFRFEYESHSFNREEIITHLFDSQMRGYELDIRNGQADAGIFVKRINKTCDDIQICLKPMDICEDYGLIELIEAIAQ